MSAPTNNAPEHRRTTTNGCTDSDSLRRLLTEAPKAFQNPAAKREDVLASAKRVVAITTAFLGDRAASLAELPERLETRTLRRRCHQAAQCVYPHLVKDAQQRDSKPHKRSRELFVELAELLGMSCEALAMECRQGTDTKPVVQEPLDPNMANSDPRAYTQAVRARIRAQLQPPSDNPL